MGVPARPLLFRQWAAPKDYGVINAVGLSLHSILLGVAISTSALLIGMIGSWRMAFFLHAAVMLVHAGLWPIVTKSGFEGQGVREITKDLKGALPASALKDYPQGWVVAVVMFALASMYSAVVTFLPSLLLEARELSLSVGGILISLIYLGLIPGGVLGSFITRKIKDGRVLLSIPAALSTLIGLSISSLPGIFLLGILTFALGVVWIVTPAIELLPFEFPDIKAREVAVMTCLWQTFSGIGFASGPVIVGCVAQMTGSLQFGLVVMSCLTVVGVMAGLLYPRPRIHAKTGE